MGERLNDYELLYILSPRVPADEVVNAIERVGALVGNAGGEVTAVDNWGRRRLAYPIRQYFEGTYVVLTLKMPPAGAAGLEASLIISDEVIRHMLTSGIIPRTPTGRSRSDEFERGEGGESMDRGERPVLAPAADVVAPALAAAVPAEVASEAAPSEAAPSEAAPSEAAPSEAAPSEAVTSEDAPEPETQPVAAAAE